MASFKASYLRCSRAVQILSEGAIDPVVAIVRLTDLSGANRSFDPGACNPSLFYPPLLAGLEVKIQELTVAPGFWNSGESFPATALLPAPGWLDD
jgi:hypothetical protein